MPLPTPSASLGQNRSIDCQSTSAPSHSRAPVPLTLFHSCQFESQIRNRVNSLTGAAPSGRRSAQSARRCQWRWPRRSAQPPRSPAIAEQHQPVSTGRGHRPPSVCCTRLGDRRRRVRSPDNPPCSPPRAAIHQARVRRSRGGQRVCSRDRNAWCPRDQQFTSPRRAALNPRADYTILSAVNAVCRVPLHKVDSCCIRPAKCALPCRMPSQTSRPTGPQGIVR